MNIVASNLELVFVLTLLMVSALSLFVVAYSYKFYARFFAVFLTIIIVSGIGGVYTNLLGNPKPISVAWVEKISVQDNDVYLLAMTKNINKSIYLWVQLPNSQIPFSYELPWNDDLAHRLEASLQEAQRNHGRVLLNNLFFDSTNVESRVHTEMKPAQPKQNERNDWFTFPPRAVPGPEPDIDESI